MFSLLMGKSKSIGVNHLYDKFWGFSKLGSFTIGFQGFQGFIVFSGVLQHKCRITYNQVNTIIN